MNEVTRSDNLQTFDVFKGTRYYDLCWLVPSILLGTDLRHASPADCHVRRWAAYLHSYICTSFHMSFPGSLEQASNACWNATLANPRLGGCRRNETLEGPVTWVCAPRHDEGNLSCDGRYPYL